MSLVVRIIAPTGRDADLLFSVLSEHGIASAVSRNVSDLLEENALHPLGPLLIAQEALTPQLTVCASWFCAGPAGVVGHPHPHRAARRS